MNTRTTVESATEDLRENLRSIARDAEALWNATADVAEDGVQDARQRAETTLRQARSLLNDRKLRRQASAWARSTGDYVREHPWGVIGAAAGAAIVIGLLANRRRTDVDQMH
jgi:ElaB/YqjD/DUF883 family membrane-anchored ribosome-binding protein